MADRVPTVSVVVYAVGLAVLCEILHFHGQLPASGTGDLRVITERLLHLGVAAEAVPTREPVGRDKKSR